MTIHIVFTTFNKPCTYAGVEQLGFPKLGTIHLLPGSSVSHKVKTWCENNWMYDVGIMHWLNEFIKSEHDKEVISYPVSNKIAKQALEGVIQFIKEHRETLKHIDTAFNTKIKEPIVPKISKEVLSMSYAERQKLLRDNIQGRLEENKDV